MIQYCISHQTLTNLSSHTSFVVQAYTPGLLKKSWYMFEMKEIKWLLKHIHIYLPEDLWLQVWGTSMVLHFSFNLLSQSRVAKVMWVTMVLQSLTQQLTYEVCNPEVAQPVFPECELSENQQTPTCLLLAWSVVCCCRQGCGRLLGLWTIKHKQKFTSKMAERESGSSI